MAWLNHVLCLHCHCVLTRLHKKRTRCTATGLKNGAKRTRTADPLHAMQVLYQLSYGPIDVAGLACHILDLTPRPDPAQTWRHTATSFPWMATSSAGTRMGA
jgi:hypothetical protein